MRRLILEEPVSKAAEWSRSTAVFAAAVALVSLIIIRGQFVDVTAGVSVFASAVFLACVALLLAGAAFAVIWRTGRRGLGQALAGAVLALALLAVPGFYAARAIMLPVMSEVSTDLADPPQYSMSAAALAARGGHTPEEQTLAQRTAQREAYPNVQAILLELDADEAWQLVLQAVQARGWKIIEQTPPGPKGQAGHIDAVDRSLIMALPDDIAIRVKPLAGQTKIDLRSASRYGRNDFGANAQRIEQFAQEVQNQLDDR
ncbi:MAG: DUF1499 domain-containing protein [Hyphomicrobiales bacterium]|nr:DUF1499 domain-containing protein [Hyphomicrobiales bacterium]